MRKPQIITSPSGEELVVLPLRDYEDIVDALAVNLMSLARLPSARFNKAAAISPRKYGDSEVP
jgi:hypothetical protein